MLQVARIVSRLPRNESGIQPELVFRRRALPRSIVSNQFVCDKKAESESTDRAKEREKIAEKKREIAQQEERNGALIKRFLHLNKAERFRN